MSLQFNNIAATPSVDKTESSVISLLVIVDESGSMSSMSHSTVPNLKEFYQTQKGTGKEFLSTMVFFNDTVKFVHTNVKGSSVEIENDYHKPNGMTALYDAIGASIGFQRNIKSDNVICVIITDGHENSSKIYNGNDIKKLTKEMTEKGWTFVYLGANQDSFGVSKDLGLNPMFSHTYEQNDADFSKTMRTLSADVSACISSEFSSSKKFTTSFQPPPQPQPHAKIVVDDISDEILYKGRQQVNFSPPCGLTRTISDWS